MPIGATIWSTFDVNFLPFSDVTSLISGRHHFAKLASLSIITSIIWILSTPPKRPLGVATFLFLFAGVGVCLQRLLSFFFFALLAPNHLSLDASTHLYRRVFPSVGLSVHPYVRPSGTRFIRDTCIFRTIHTKNTRAYLHWPEDYIFNLRRKWISNYSKQI